MGKPTLMFCVGATKAGTSWLYETLAAHPDCHLRSIKELHYFDALEKGKLDREVAQTEAMKAQFEGRLPGAPADRAPELRRKIADRAAWLDVLRRGEDRDAYLGYLSEGRGERRVIGDVTPAYALLPADRLRAMAGLTADVRFVYLLRDPVARLWSHVRMIAKRRGGGPLDPQRAKNILRRTLRGEETEIEARGDYAAALGRLSAAVAPAKRLVMFYEEMFSSEGLARLCRFLGLAPMAPDAARRVHAGAPMDMPEGLRAKAREWLAPQYDFVARWAGRLPEAWQANMVRV